MQFKSVLAVFLLMAACSSSGPDDDSAGHRCLEMRDHLVDLRLGDASNTDASEHKVALSAALGSGFIERCTSAMPKHQVQCVLDAKDSDAAALCTSQSR